MEQSIRSFVAIALPGSTRGQIKALIEELRKSEAKVGWVKSEGIHLTLKFLGNVSPEIIESIKPVLSLAAGKTGPIRLEPAGCGAFPGIKAPRVIWVGLRGQIDSLGSLAQRVEEGLIASGFAPGDRPFKPHLTLGRVKDRVRLQRLQEILVSHADFVAEPFDASQIVLYKSELRPDGARYIPLFKAPFSGNPATADE